MNEFPVSVLPLFARREQLLELLRDGPRSKSELVRSLDVSRSTVDRCVRELESSELVARVDEGFRLTLAGSLLLDEYERYRERATGIVDAQSLLSALAVDADIAPGALRGATVTLADRTDPYRPVEEYLSAVLEADHVDHISTALSPQYVQWFRRVIVDEGVETRLGASESVTRRFVAEFDDVLAEIVDADHMTMRELETHPGYSLGIVETGETTTAHYLVYDDDGIRGRIETADPEAVAAARDVFERYWADGTPIGGTER